MNAVRDNIATAFAKIANIAFPAVCSECGSRVERIGLGSTCSKCWGSTRIFSGAEVLCRKCGRERPTQSESCNECTSHYFDSAAAVGEYTSSLKAAILRLKSEPHIPATLKNLIVKRLRAVETDADLVIPVPLSRTRRFERGFNQAEVIARLVGRALSLPVDAYSLTRIKHTAMHRAGMDKKAREKTVEKAFEVTRPKLVAGKRILLIDDVLTSGSTASSCAKILKAGGTESVSLFTIARV